MPTGIVFDITEIVDKHSGGLKFNDLLVELIGKGYDPPTINFPEDIENLISQTPNIKILHYVSKMGTTARDKMFIYREST